MAKEDINDEQETEEKKGGSSSLKIIIISVVLSVLLGGGLVGGTMFLLGDTADETAAAGAEEGEEPDEDAAEENAVATGPVVYTALDPKFVVSFHDQRKARFMQFALQIMTRDNAVTKDIEMHMPAIRSNLLMLIGSQEYDVVSTREGKEKLLVDITDNINATLETLDATSGVEAAYFESFVIQ
ncbi:MAG: flagellar basal body-associated FliL family protein [Gammaproteobacteria bacterium]